MRFCRTDNLKTIKAEVRVKTEDIILPYFVVEGRGIRRPIRSMPGIYHLSVDNLIKDIKEARDIRYVLLFGLPREKDQRASEAYRSDGIVQKAVRAVKKEARDLTIITDVCLCSYTSHGHCRILEAKSEKRKAKNYIVDDGATLKTLARIASSHAEAGAHFVAPSAVMPGQVRAIRQALDGQGFRETKILAYSAKYASNFYGPFREALDSSPRFGDRTGYQLDFKDPDEALERIGREIEEGADIVMVKPALPYLDVIYKAKKTFNTPIAAYNVSGEYAMIKAYCKGTGNREHRAEFEKRMVLEILTGIKRAGADLIITYHAKDIAKWLRES